MNSNGPPFKKRPGSAQRASYSTYRREAAGLVRRRNSLRFLSSSGFHGRTLSGGSTSPTRHVGAGAGPARGTWFEFSPIGLISLGEGPLGSFLYPGGPGRLYPVSSSGSSAPRGPFDSNC